MKWVEFVKDYAKKNNIKYGEALKKAKDAWAKHKESSPEHSAKKTKPKKKATKAKKKKSPKAKKGKSNVKMTITAKDEREEQALKNLEFALEKDAEVQRSLTKRKAKEDLLDAQTTAKTYTEFLVELRGQGVSAAEAPTLAKRKVAEQKLKTDTLKQTAGVPIGGAFDPNVLKGVQKTKLNKYKKLKVKVEKDIKEGLVKNREFNSLIALAKHLAGTSKTNQYAKLVKKLEKQINSKAYNKLTRTQLKQAQKEDIKQNKLARAAVQDKGRRDKATIDKIFENRKKQLIRLGASEVEAENLAREEGRAYKEQQDLQKQLQIEKFRKTGRGNIATGGLTYSQFVEKTAKDKGISFNLAQTQVKNKNLYQKYQIQAVRSGAAPIVGSTTALPVIPTLPTGAIGKSSKYITKKGQLSKKYSSAVETLITKYGVSNATKNTNSNEGMYRIHKTRGKIDADLRKLREYSNIDVLDPVTKARLSELTIQLQDYDDNGLDTHRRILQAQKKGKGKAAAKPAVPKQSKMLKEALKTASKPLTKKGTLGGKTVNIKFNPPKDAKDFIDDLLSNDALTDEDKFQQLDQMIEETEKELKEKAAVSITKEELQNGFDEIQFFKNVRDDLDEDLEGAGLVGGSMLQFSQDDLEHDGGDGEEEEDLEGGAFKDTVRDIGKKFKSGLVRKLKQVPEPINVVMRGVGAIKGRKVVKQNAIDAVDKHLLKMTIASYAPKEDRRAVDGFTYNASSSNDEHAVYVNEATKKIVVAYRGSRTQEDWLVSDKYIAKGKLEDSPRFKRELKFTEGLLDVIPKDYTVDFTGSSLGGTLAYTLGHATKQRAVVFNPGVGIDGAKKHGDDNTKFYHAEGDPISVMGVGAFKDSRMVRNSAGNFAVAHSTSVFQTPKEGGFSLGNHEDEHPLEPNSQTEQSQLERKVASLEADKQALAKEDKPSAKAPVSYEPDGSTPAANPAHYGDLGDFTPYGQKDIRNMTQRDLDTYGINIKGDPIGGSFKKIATNKINKMTTDLSDFEKMYSPNNINSVLGGAFNVETYTKFKDNHDEKLDKLEKQVAVLGNYRKRVDKSMKGVVDTHHRHLAERLNYIKKHNSPMIQKHLEDSLGTRLNHDNRRLTNLQIHGTRAVGGALYNNIVKKNYVEDNRHHKQLFKQMPYANIDKDGHARMGKVMSSIGDKIGDKLKKGQPITNREHIKIKRETGMSLNKIKMNPHYSHYVGKVI